MSAATVDLTDRASHRERSPFRRALGVGIVLGLVAVYGATVGILPLMDARWVIVEGVPVTGESRPSPSCCRSPMSKSSTPGM